MATKFTNTYKMRSGGKWDVGSGTRPTENNLNFLFFIFSKLIKMRLHLNKISVSKSVLFSSAANFFPRCDRKVLPRVGNADTFADRQAQQPRFGPGIDLMFHFKR
jgi:hypothetical protein